MAVELNVNGTTHEVDCDPQTPLLWVVRDSLGLTGTKFSCGIAQCGACTLHVDGQPVRSCSFPVSLAVGAKGLAAAELTAVTASPVTATPVTTSVAWPGAAITRS